MARQSLEFGVSAWGLWEASVIATPRRSEDGRPSQARAGRPVYAGTDTSDFDNLESSGQALHRFALVLGLSPPRMGFVFIYTDMASSDT